MHLTFFPLLFCLLGLVASSSIPLSTLHQQRDLASVEKSITRYMNSLQDLISAIARLDENFQGDTLRQGQDIEQKCKTVTETMKQEGRKVRAQERLGPMDTLRLTFITFNLSTVQDQVSRAWIAQRDTIVLAGARQVVFKMLKDQLVAYDEFNDAVMSRLPPDMGLGSQVAEMSRKWLTDAIYAFK